jgi:spore germination cell wall hydrolase CwlJ-like protein
MNGIGFSGNAWSVGEDGAGEGIPVPLTTLAGPGVATQTALTFGVQIHAMLRSCIPALARASLASVALAGLAGCATAPFPATVESDERQCMARVMFFESLRNSDEGMLAVGTVVMNRLESGRYPHTVCGVVGQTNQFAPGALTRSFQGEGRERALRMADAVLSGQRHPTLGKNVMFFHTQGYTFPYHNMHYVLNAGGNSFYFKDPAMARQWAMNQQPTAYAPADLTDAEPPQRTPDLQSLY